VSDVAEHIAAADLVLVTTIPIRHASALQTSLTVGGTLVVRLAMSVGLGSGGPCVHCAWRAAGEWALAHATSRVTEEIIFER
jgi:hypothetical protein